MAMYINAKIVRSSLEKSKAKGTPYVCLHLELQGDKDGFLPEGVAKTQYSSLWLTTKTIDNTKKTLRALGWKGQNILELHHSNPLAEVECSVTGDFELCEDGNERFRVQWVNTKAHKPKDIGDGREFTAFNKFLKDDGSKQETKPLQATQGGDDDLPF